MADRLFWRVLGVFLVVGLFAIAYGLYRISPLPSPSFSSAAHADDLSSAAFADDFPFQRHGVRHLVTADDRYMRKYLPPLPGNPIEENDASNRMPPLTKGHWEMPAPAAADGLFGAVVVHTATPSDETKEPATKPADDVSSESPKKPKTVKIILETKEGEGILYDLDEITVAEVKKMIDGKALTALPIQGIFRASVPIYGTAPTTNPPSAAAPDSWTPPPSATMAAPTNPPVATYPYLANPPASSYSTPNSSTYASPPPTNPPHATVHFLPYTITPVPAVQPSKMTKLDFRPLNSSFQILRAEVPDGWLILMPPGGITFYPDPEHKWDGGSGSNKK